MCSSRVRRVFVGCSSGVRDVWVGSRQDWRALRWSDDRPCVVDDCDVIPEEDFRSLVDSVFAWLVARGCRTSVTGYGNLGYSAVLADDRHWLRLSWETRDGAIRLGWGDALPPGRFNDDPYRNPRPLQDLIPDHSTQEIEMAGSVDGGRGDEVGSALLRLAHLVREAGAGPLTEQ
jgi:hypothetical protein